MSVYALLKRWVLGLFSKRFFVMAEDSESAASQQSLELDDQDTCGIDGDNEEENEHMQG